MTKLQAAFYLILAIGGFALFAWVSYRVMVYIFTELNKRKKGM
jgi:hypothetical protein